MKQKWFYFLGSFIILLFIILSFHISGQKSFIKEISYAKYQTLLQANDSQVIYFSSNDCEGCGVQRPILEHVASMYDMSVYELQLNKLTDEELKDFVSLLGDDITRVITPSLYLVKNGKLLAYENGFLDQSALMSFLIQHDIVSGLASIDFETYFDYLLGEDKILLYLGSSECVYCKEYKPILEDILREHKLVGYYLDKDTLTDEQRLELMNSLDELYDGIATPQLLILQKGESLGQFVGMKSKEQIIEFLTMKGFIK